MEWTWMKRRVKWWRHSSANTDVLSTLIWCLSASTSVDRQLGELSSLCSELSTVLSRSNGNIASYSGHLRHLLFLYDQINICPYKVMQNWGNIDNCMATKWMHVTFTKFCGGGPRFRCRLLQKLWTTLSCKQKLRPLPVLYITPVHSFLITKVGTLRCI